MITFRNVVGLFETIATNHYEINSFHSGFMDEVDINKLGATDYVILYAEPGSATINTGTLVYTFTIYVLDMINDELGDSPNNERLGRLDTFSENLQILQDVINEFKQNLYYSDAQNEIKGSWVDNEIILQTPINLEPFTARFNNLLTGWSAQLSIQVNNTNNLCIVPINPPT
jgi:hypothetical protein|tara:strand:- start:5509 stop:6024 length:516 start_codon:yes stop_codon:yes gene_type:complete